MIVGFYLSMPCVTSWNGRWSGEGQLYARTKSYRNPPDSVMGAIMKGRFTHRFSDGWVAAVEVKQIDAKESRRIGTNSKGFCGYDWMIDSILQHGGIYTEAPKTEQAPAQ